MNRNPRRLAALALAILLIVGVGYGILNSAKDALGPAAVSVRGLIGSEKDPFFKDARVVAALKRGGFVVSVSTAGSRQIAGSDLSSQDFAFPAGVPAAEKIRLDHPGSKAFVPFYTPMAIATWKPIVDLLTKAGVVHAAGGATTLDVAAYMKLVGANTRWKDLPGNTAYPVNKSILVTSTDVRKSNSAAMYLALTSYVANGNNIVQNGSSVAPLMDGLAPLFLRQGFVASSSEEPFDDYLVQGMGKSPMVMIYESQFIQRAAAGDGSITPLSPVEAEIGGPMWVFGLRYLSWLPDGRFVCSLTADGFDRLAVAGADGSPPSVLATPFTHLSQVVAGPDGSVLVVAGTPTDESAPYRITLGAGSPAALVLQARELAAVLGGGALQQPLRVLNHSGHCQ